MAAGGAGRGAGGGGVSGSADDGEAAGASSSQQSKSKLRMTGGGGGGFGHARRQGGEGEGERLVAVAAVQFACVEDREANMRTAVRLIRSAHARGAHIILLQELFQGPYFCQTQDADNFARAETRHNNPTIQRFQALARELGVVLPISFFERANNAHFNSLVVIDADGTDLGLYRKSHIPDGPGYQEKFYFSPGDTGFKVFKTKYATIGCGICWDQWYPEAARAMALLGAELLLYPTAIGSEPHDPSLDSRAHWARVMQGHAAANMVPVVVSNRVGMEPIGDTSITFYGSSFIADGTGAIVEAASAAEEAVLVATLDLRELQTKRSAWGLFRDRRPDLYAPLLSLDGAPSPSAKAAAAAAAAAVNKRNAAALVLAPSEPGDAATVFTPERRGRGRPSKKKRLMEQQWSLLRQQEGMLPPPGEMQQERQQEGQEEEQEDLEIAEEVIVEEEEGMGMEVEHEMEGGGQQGVAAGDLGIPGGVVVRGRGRVGGRGRPPGPGRGRGRGRTPVKSNFGGVEGPALTPGGELLLNGNGAEPSPSRGRGRPRGRPRGRGRGWS